MDRRPLEPAVIAVNRLSILTEPTNGHRKTLVKECWEIGNSGTNRFTTRPLGSGRVVEVENELYNVCQPLSLDSDTENPHIGVLAEHV